MKNLLLRLIKSGDRGGLSPRPLPGEGAKHTIAHRSSFIILRILGFKGFYRDLNTQANCTPSWKGGGRGGWIGKLSCVSQGFSRILFLKDK